jgi:AraC-like DNA-binding protein
VTYREFPPSPLLRHLVERLWVLEMRVGVGGVDPILPDGRTEVIVHCGDPFRERRPDGELRVQERLLVAGQLQRAVHLSPAGPSLIVGARLQPHGAAVLFRAPQHELTDRIVDLTAVDPRLARRLVETVIEPAMATRRDAVACDLHASLAAALDGALRSLAIERGGDPDLPAGRAAALASARRGLVRVEALASHLGVTERQLERMFLRDIGLAPKQFLRTIRFQEVLRQLQSGTPTRWADLALRLGFYDQAHFIRDFKAFTGHTPTHWATAENSLTAIFSGR